jgi:hypothetical protein
MIHFHVVAERRYYRDILSTEIRVIPKAYSDFDVPSERIIFMYNFFNGGHPVV